MISLSERMQIKLVRLILYVDPMQGGSSSHGSFVLVKRKKWESCLNIWKGIWNWITLNGRERERERERDGHILAQQMKDSKWNMYYFLCCYVVVTFDYCLGWIHNKPTIIVADGGGSPGVGGKVRVQQHPAGGTGRSRRLGISHLSPFRLHFAGSFATLAGSGQGGRRSSFASVHRH